MSAHRTAAAKHPDHAAAERWERVFSLFDAAVGWDAASRPARLSEQCGDDFRLREDVEALIAAHFDADGFLSAHGFSSDSEDAPRPHHGAPTLRSGTALGAFVIDMFIGAGGMGEVYRAQDTRLDRRVAIKVLPSASATDPRNRARFAYEARAVARLSHPRICALHDIGHHDGIDFLVMEYLQGETLAARLRRGPLPLAVAIKTGIEIAEALNAAHRQGIVHGDLKPANIMLAPEGAKLLDFGLARLRGTDGWPASRPGADDSTAFEDNPGHTGLLAGTLPYMAPEQLQHQESNQLTDLFAFGTVMYEMVTGSRPFSADSQPGIAAAILDCDPVPLRERQPLTPLPLDALVAKCLESDPRRRWQDAQEIVVALTAIASGPRDAAAIIGASGWWTRSRGTGLFARFVIVAAVAAGGWWASRYSGVPRSPVTLAVLPVENIGRDLDRQYVADGLTDETSASLGQVDPERLSVIGRTSTLRYKGTTKSIAVIGEELGADYVIESSIRVEGDRLRLIAKLIRVRTQTQIWSQSYERSLTNLLGLEQELSTAVAEQIRLRLSPERQAAIAHRQSSNPAAYDLFLRGRAQWNQLTPASTRRAIDYYTQATMLDPAYALAWSGIADAYSAGPINGDAPPQQVRPRARDAVARAIGADPNLAEARASEGAFKFWLDWDWTAAEATLRRAIVLDPNYPFEHLLLGMVLSHRGQHAEATAAIRRARELDPLSAAYQALSAQVAFNARDYGGATQFARQAIVIDPEFWVGYQELGQAYEQTGQTALALAAISNAERFSGGGNSKTVSLRGYILAKAGNVDAAHEVLTALETAYPDRYMPPSATALVYAGLGDRDAMFEWLEKAFAAHDVHLAFLPVDPKWDPYRADPRFLSLEARCGFSGAPEPVRSRPQSAGRNRANPPASQPH